MHIFLDMFRRNVESHSVAINNEVKTSMLQGLSGHCPVISTALENALESNPTRCKRITIAVFCFIDYTGRNFGQVYFCNNPFTGFILLAALFWMSPAIALSGLVASTISIVFALVMDESRERLRSGMSGCNSVLVGTALYNVLFDSNLEKTLCWSLLILMSALAVVLSNSMGRTLSILALPALTLPFNILAVFSTVLLDVHTAALTLNNDTNTSKMTENALIDEINYESLLLGGLLAAGQVFAVQDSFCSILVLLSLVPCSPILTVCTIFGSFIGTFMSAAISPMLYELAYSGILSYNALIASCAVSTFYLPIWHAVPLMIVAAIVSTASHVSIVWALGNIYLPVFTIPSVIGTLLVVGGNKNNIIHPMHHNAWTANKNSSVPDTLTVTHTSISSDGANSSLFVPDRNTPYLSSIRGSSMSVSSSPSFRSEPQHTEVITDITHVDICSDQKLVVCSPMYRQKSDE